MGLILCFAAPASAAPSPVGGWASGRCPTYGDTEVCSGEVPSFDGAPLDVDLTKPSGGQGGVHPLIVMLHGFSNDKHEWESTSNSGDGADKHRWNSHWFAQHGYYVLTYTARGFRTDEPERPDQPNTPAGTSVSEPNGHIMLKSREFEARDTQWLAAIVAQRSSARSIPTRLRLRVVPTAAERAGSWRASRAGPSRTSRRPGCRC